MRSPVTMEALAERLAMMGFVIAPHGDHIGLRLSLWTSVRVHVVEGRLTVDAFFGPLPRKRATAFKTLGLSVLALGSLAFASLTPDFPLPAALAVGFLGLAWWGYDGVRYTLTESCSAQVRQAYNALLSEAQPALTAAAQTFSQARALDAGEPAFIMQDARVHTRVK